MSGEFNADYTQTAQFIPGVAAGNDIELAAGPAQFGRIRLRGDEVLFAAADGGPQVLVSNSTGERSDPGRTWHVLAADASGAPSIVSVDSVSFLVIKRAEKFALRVRDSEAKTLKQFAGIEHFPVDESWRIVADWTQHETPQSFGIQTVIRDGRQRYAAGRAECHRRDR